MNNLQQLMPAFFTGEDGQNLTPEQLQQRQQVAKSLMGNASDVSPNAGGFASIASKGLQGLAGGYQQNMANTALVNGFPQAPQQGFSLGSIFGMGNNGGGGIGGLF